MVRKAAVNTLIYGIGPQVPKFAGILILPIISRDLTAADFGIFGVIQAYGLALSYLKTLGTDVVLSNAYFKHPRYYKLLWQHIGGMLHVWAFVLSAVLAGIILIFLGTDNPYITEIIILNCLPLFLFSTTENLFFRYYQLQQRPLPISTRVIVTGLINVLVTYYTIHHLKLGYRGWFYASFVAAMVSFLWMFYPVYIRHRLFPVFALRWRYLKRTLKISLPILPHFYGNYLLSSSDRVVMNLLHVPTAPIGRYNAAYMFGNYFVILATASKRAIAPMLQLYYSKQQWEKAKRIIIYWQVTFLIGTTLFAIWMKEVIPFFIRTEDLGDVHGMAVWIVMATNYTPMYAGANSIIFFFEETSALWKRALVACAINIGLNLVLIPFFGVYAAAVNTFIAYMYLGYSSYFMSAYRKRNNLKLNPILWLLITTGLTLFSVVVVDLEWTYKLAITGVFSVALAFFMYNIIKIRRESRRIQS